MPTKISIEQAFGTGVVQPEDKSAQPTIRFGDRTTKPKQTQSYDLSGSTPSQPRTGGSRPKDILGDLHSIADDFGTVITSGRRKAINYGAGAGSAHGRGMAGDFRTSHMTKEQGDALVARLRSAGYWVNDERFNWQEKNPKTGKQRGTGPHIHAEWRGGGKVEASTAQPASTAAPKKRISLADAFGQGGIATAAEVQAAAKPVPKPNGSTGVLDWANRYIAQPVKRTASAVGQHLYDRFMTDMGQIKPDDPRYKPTMGANPTLQDIQRRDPFIENRRIRARGEARAKAEELARTLKPGFWANLRNPVDLITSDSLPANFLEWVGGAYERGYDKLMEAKKVQMQENIIAHPEQFPAVSVQAAREASAARKAKQGHGVAEMWSDLTKSAKEDPGRFGATLINAIIADPEMLFAPQGIGAKMATGTARVVRGSEVASKAMQIADRVTDAAATGAALNLGIEATAAASEGRTLTADEAKFSAALGAGFSAALSPLGRGKAAREKLRAGEVTQETFEQVLKDVAQEELTVESILENKNPIDRRTKHQIEEATGVQFESEADLRQYLTNQRKEWRALFAERDLNGQYQKALAEERMSRRTQLAEEQEAAAAAKEAEGAKQAEVEQAYQEGWAARLSRFNDDYEKALAARESADVDNIHEQALKEADLRESQAKLDQEEIFAAAFDEDVPAIRNAMLRAAQRDEKLRVPKWQRGEIDPRLLTRLGIGSLFAGTAYALTDTEEAKLPNAFLAGLAALVMPGGGKLNTVGTKLRQMGAVADDGFLSDTAAWLYKNGKMLVGRNVDEQMARDADAIERAKAGDQSAFTQLYEEHSPKLVRVANRKLGNSKGRAGVDGEDIVLDAYTDVFSKLEDYNGSVPFSAYMTQVVKNKAISAIRAANSEKAGKGYSIGSMYNAGKDFSGSEAALGHIAEGDNSLIKAKVEEASADIDTPEGLAIRDEVAAKLPEFFESLPKQQSEAFILNRAEELTAAEIAQIQNRPIGSVLSDIKRVQDKFLEWAEKGYGAVKTKPKVEKEIPVYDPNAPVKRGRGRPRKQSQAGEIDPRLMKVLGAATAGAIVGQWMVDNKDKEGNVREDPNAPSKLLGALAGAGMGVLLFGGAKARKSVGRGVEYVYGASSTAILNRSRAVHKRVLTVERQILSNTHKHLENVGPFLVRLNKMPKEGRDVLARALMTGRSDVINKILTAFGDQELTAAYAKVRSTLDSLGDQLVNLRRFSKGNIEYFPRIVKDKEGLFKAIGKKEADNIKGIIDNANVESIKKNGRPLSDIEESALINQLLFADKRSTQPGFTKNRAIEEITPELQKYYATPGESLHSYIRAAVQDIEAAKFFGNYAVNMKRGQHQFLDVDSSVKNMIADEVRSGKLSDEDAQVVADILRTRFKEGLRSENETIRNIKNIGNIGLLGNFWSAATQLGDIPIQLYTQGMMPTFESIVRQLTRKKLVDMKDFGLADHIAEEFAGQLRTSKWVNKVFKATLFAGVDSFGKNTALNAAVIKAMKLAKTEAGQLKLANKYRDAFGDDFGQFVSDLKAGKITDLTRDYAFMELSRTQPISRIEMPQAYLKHPNARSYLWLKSFTMKQLDLVRREAFNEIKTGTPKGIAKGVKNLAHLSIVLGFAGVTADVVKDYLHNGIAALTGGKMKDVEVTRGDLFMNIFKTFGFSQYTLDKAVGVSRQEASERRAAGDKYARPTKPTPLNALSDGFMKPAFVQTIDQLFSGDQQKATRLLVPVIGPYLSEQMRRAKEVEDGEDDE